MIRLLAIFLVAYAASQVGAGAAGATQSTRLQVAGTTMGSVQWSVTAVAPGEREAEIRAAAEAALANVDNRMSTYKPSSEVSRFNDSRSTDWFEVAENVADVVRRAIEISEASDGAFDITVEPLVKLWKFGPDKSGFTVPDDDAIARQLAAIGYKHLSVRHDPPAIRKTIPELRIDLSAIAKGYAVDQVAARLDELGIGHYLVEVGGEVRARGNRPDGSPWRVGIEAPTPGSRSVWGTVELRNSSLASSGDYRNFYEVDGRRYSHTIDPRTGRPVQGGPSAVSVLADDCMTADAVATAVMVMGRERGLAMAESLGAEVLVLEPAAEPGGFVQSATEGFELQRAGTASAAPSLWRTVAVASIFFLIAILAMGVGAFFGRQRLRGSCGGIAALDDPNADPNCPVCSVTGNECRELKKAIRNKSRTPAANG